MSSILETFIILFESNAKKAATDVESYKKALDRGAESAKDAADADNKLTTETAGAGKAAIEAAVDVEYYTTALIEGALRAENAAYAEDKLRTETEGVGGAARNAAVDFDYYAKALAEGALRAEEAAYAEDRLRTATEGAGGAAGGAAPSAKKLSEELGRMGKKALGAIAGIVALTQVIKGVFSQTEDLHDLLNTSKALNVNIGELDAWGKAIEANGGSAEKFQSSLESLNSKLTEVSITGKSDVLPYFNALGISMLDATGQARSTLDVLPELADAFQGLSASESMQFGKKLGLDQQTILTLQQGRREVEALVDKQKSLGVATEEAAELSAEFNKNMSNLKNSLGSMSQSVLVKVLPAINWMLDLFTSVSDWVKDNQALVEGVFIGIGAAILFFAIPPLILMAKTMILATWPFILIGLAVAALIAIFAILWDDVKAFFNGQDSLLGEALKLWEKFGDWVGEIFDALIEGFKAFGDGIVAVFTSPLKALMKLWELAKKVGRGIKGFFGFGGGDDDDASEAIEAAQDQVIAAGDSELGSQTSNSVSSSNSSSNRNTTVNVGEIAIQTEATDADGIMAEAAQSLDNQLRSTVENYDDGVLM